MTAAENTAARVGGPKQRRQITLERRYPAPVEDVWELWTTADGIESWWGPDGFTVKVRALDLRVGGEMGYAMIAQGADEIAFMEKSGMPATTEHRLTFTEIVPPRRLVYTQLADFIPGVEAYEVGTKVELFPDGEGTRLVVTFDAMHDDRWTQMSVAGLEMELGKLARALEARTKR